MSLISFLGMMTLLKLLFLSNLVYQSSSRFFRPGLPILQYSVTGALEVLQLRQEIFLVPILQLRQLDHPAVAPPVIPNVKYMAPNTTPLRAASPPGKRSSTYRAKDL